MARKTRFKSTAELETEVKELKTKFEELRSQIEDIEEILRSDNRSLKAILSSTANKAQTVGEKRKPSEDRESRAVPKRRRGNTGHLLAQEDQATTVLIHSIFACTNE